MESHERPPAAVDARPVFDALIAAIERRRAASEKLRDDRCRQGLQRSEDTHRGRVEAFAEAILLVQLVRAGASLAQLNAEPGQTS